MATIEHNQSCETYAKPDDFMSLPTLKHRSASARVLLQRNLEPYHCPFAISS